MRPDKFTYTLILSSPAHFVAEMESQHFLLTHAWPTFGSDRDDFHFGSDSRYSRHFFALTFREHELTQEDEKQRNPPHYAFVGEWFSVFLSLYFGKRFNCHGFMLDHGLYCLPNVQPSRPRRSVGALPFTSNPRKDLGISLNLGEATSLVPILDSVFAVIDGNGSISDDLNLAFTAGRFYEQALQLYDSNSEFAFLSLVNAGEVLVSCSKFEPEELLCDEETKALLAEVEANLKPVTAKIIRGNLRSVIATIQEGPREVIERCILRGK